MNINPVINLVSSAIGVYSFFLICYIIIHYLFLFKVINPYNQFVVQIHRILIRLIDPVLSRIRRFVPNIAGIDISIIILFLLLQFTRDILYTYLYVR